MHSSNLHITLSTLAGFILLLIVFSAPPLLAQTEPSADDETGTITEVESNPTAPANEESTGLTPEEIEALILAPREGDTFHDSSALLIVTKEKKSPKGALLRSLVLPGWGQFYNHAWWKGFLVIGGEVTFAAVAVRQYLKSKDCLRKSRQTSGSESDYYLDRYKYYQVEMEKYGWFFVGVLVFSMLDAYVDAHLYDWEVGDIEKEAEGKKEQKFSLDLAPWEKGLGLSLNASF
jgi:hypothetical protein